jgi:hypothetical protein
MRRRQNSKTDQEMISKGNAEWVFGALGIEGRKCLDTYMKLPQLLSNEFHKFTRILDYIKSTYCAKKQEKFEPTHVTQMFYLYEVGQGKVHWLGQEPIEGNVNLLGKPFRGKGSGEEQFTTGALGDLYFGENGDKETPCIRVAIDKKVRSGKAALYREGRSRA